MIRLAFLAFLTAVAQPAGATTAAEIIARSGAMLDGVNDFTVVMTFNVRSPSARVPDSRVRIYFKQPDKFKPEPIDGDFAILPRTYELAIGNLLQRLAEDHTATLVREEKLGNRDQWVLKMTPRDPDSPVRYHDVHVDQEQYTVSRIRTYPKQERPLTMTMGYQRWRRAYLPSTTTISGHHRIREGEVDKIEPITVTLKFTGYRVNTGLADSLFQDK